MPIERHASVPITVTLPNFQLKINNLKQPKNVCFKKEKARKLIISRDVQLQ